MPLTRKGKAIKKAFEIEYGKHRGKSIFYAYEHTHHNLKRRSKV